MISFIPTILETDIDSVRKRIDVIRPLFSTAAVDVMDGVFVPNSTLYDAQDFEAIGTDLQCEFHLMVKNVEAAIESWSQYSNAFRIVFHFEATHSPSKMIALIEQKGLEVGMAVNPDTPLSAFDHVGNRIHLAHVMGVHPGFNGQEFQPDTVERVKKLRERFPNLKIQVDGGVNDKTLKPLVDAGATSFSIGSYFTDNIAEKLRNLKQIIA